MSVKQKQGFLKNTVKNIVVDQLLASEPASLGINTILKGVQCKFTDYSQSDLSDLLDDMTAKHELLKLIDAETGVRFKLTALRNSSISQEEDR